MRVGGLGACESGRRDDVNVWSSVAAALLKAKLGAVVGMQYTVRDDCAVAFADAFYRALVAGLPIDEAVTAGRISVTQLDARDWGVPVLYLRAEDGVVFPEYAQNSVLEEAREALRVQARLRVGELRGQAVVLDMGLGTPPPGDYDAEADIDTITESGDITVVKLGTVGGSQSDGDRQPKVARNPLRAEPCKILESPQIKTNRTGVRLRVRQYTRSRT